MSRDLKPSQRGQALPLFAIALTAIVIGVAVVVDGGFAFAQRRVAQNAADFAAMAATRIVGQKLTGTPPGSGTAQNVRNAIDSVLAANDAQFVSATYVDEDGVAVGDVATASSIPDTAFGVVVNARTAWKPFLLGVIGVFDWEAGSSATAITPGKSLGGGVLPIGIQHSTYDGLTECPLNNLNPCINQNLTSGHLNIPGGFGWLKFGLQGSGNKCDWPVSLGMLADGGCATSKPFLDSQIGPPANSHGCCTEVGLPGSEDKIGSLTGNEWGDLSYYTDNRIPVWVPIWSTAAGTGSNAYYDIVGFGAIVLTGDDEHARWLEGASVDVDCGIYTVSGHDYCSAPGGAFTVDVTGEVKLVK